MPRKRAPITGTAVVPAGAGAKSVEALQSHPEWTKELDEKELRFVTEYLVDCDAHHAVLRAEIFPLDENSPQKVGAWVSRMMKSQKVCHAIWMASRTILGDGLRASILHRLAAIAFSNMGDFVTIENQTVKMKNSAQMTREQLACIKKIKQSSGASTSIEFELHDPQTALTLLMKLLAMETSGTGDPKKDAPPPITLNFTLADREVL